MNLVMPLDPAWEYWSYCQLFTVSPQHWKCFDCKVIEHHACWRHDSCVFSCSITCQNHVLQVLQAVHTGLFARHVQSCKDWPRATHNMVGQKGCPIMWADLDWRASPRNGFFEDKTNFWKAMWDQMPTYVMHPWWWCGTMDCFCYVNINYT